MNVEPIRGGLALPGLQQYHPRSEAEIRENRRLKVLDHVPDTVRKHVVALAGEFVGTFLFLFLAFAATQIANTSPSENSAASTPNTSNLLFISLAFGFSLAVNAWVFFRITGGVFNPAVTLGLCLVGALPWIRGLVIFFGQLLGSIAASAVVSALFPGDMSVLTTLSPETSVSRGLFIEMFLTAELVFTIFMLAVEKHKATFVAPIGIGLSLFIAELAGVYYTGGSLNPARSFGPAVINAHFHGYHWIYWVGPFLGALLAVVFHRIIKGLEYETVNPTQDMSDKEVEIFKEDRDLTGSRSYHPPIQGSRFTRGMSADSSAV